jgi:type II secretory pathway predicted ATPase ExeA
MMRKIALQMEITSPAESKIQLLTQLGKRFEDVHESGKKAVVLIDEAQMLRSQELMEDFRGLLNIEMSGQKLVTFVLFGLPELDQVLALDRPLHQRVAVRYELTALNSPATEAYIKYACVLQVAREACSNRRPFP